MRHPDDLGTCNTTTTTGGAAGDADQEGGEEGRGGEDSSGVQELRAAVAKQQWFMEQLDSRDCDCNLIIIGVPEEEAFGGTVNDIVQCRKIPRGHLKYECASGYH